MAHRYLYTSGLLIEFFSEKKCASEKKKVIFPSRTECKDEGIDTRLHGIKIKSSRERDAALNCDNFTSENLIRYPLIERWEKRRLVRVEWKLDSQLRHNDRKFAMNFLLLCNTVNSFSS